MAEAPTNRSIHKDLEAARDKTLVGSHAHLAATKALRLKRNQRITAGVGARKRELVRVLLKSLDAPTAATAAAFPPAAASAAAADQPPPLPQSWAPVDEDAYDGGQLPAVEGAVQVDDEATLASVVPKEVAVVEEANVAVVGRAAAAHGGSHGSLRGRRERRQVGGRTVEERGEPCVLFVLYRTATQAADSGLT